MRPGLILPIILLSLAACSRPPATKQYELQGQILAVRPETKEVLIRHGDIQGFMPAMTMPFKVRDEALLAGRRPGDLVTATLVVADVDAHLSAMTTTGHEPLESPALGDLPKILMPGDEVRDALLVDQDGKPRPFSSLRGHRVALTFIYTRCPLPEFCPMMDRHFAAVQTQITSTPALADVHLVTMTLDPAYDTPAVLKPYAQKRAADPRVWSFVTAEPDEAARFGSQFGLYVEHNPQSAIDITHNLVTAVIDASGRLVKLHTGNDWTPTELVADLNAAAASAN
jgi:protein SCO1/2